MTDNTDLIAVLQRIAEFMGDDPFFDDLVWAERITAAADALAARDAACGHLDNELVAKALDLGRYVNTYYTHLTDDEWDTLRAATFQVTE